MKPLLLLVVSLLLLGNTIQLFAEEAPGSSLSTAVNQSKPVPQASPGIGLAGKPETKTIGKKPGIDQAGYSEPPAMANGVLQVTLGLFVVLMVIAGAAWFARRFGNFNVTAKGNLRIIGGLHMGSRERVVLMQVGDTQLLLGVAPGRIQTLHVLEQPVEINDPAAGSESNPIQRFSTLLKKVQQK